MSGLKFVATLLLLMLSFAGAGYLVNHWGEVVEALPPGLESRLATLTGSASEPATGPSGPAAEPVIVQAVTIEPAATKTTAPSTEVAAATVETAASTTPVAAGTTSATLPTASAPVAESAGTVTAEAPISDVATATTAAEAPAVAAPEAPVVETRTPAVTIAAPAFDAINLGSVGPSVIAGTAAPGASISVLANGGVIGSTVADETGAWLIDAGKSLPAGDYALSIASRAPGATADSVTAAIARVTVKPVIVAAAEPAATAAADDATAKTEPAGSEPTATLPREEIVALLADDVASSEGKGDPASATVAPVISEPAETAGISPSTAPAASAPEAVTAPATKSEPTVIAQSETTVPGSPSPTEEPEVTPSLLDRASEMMKALTDKTNEILGGDDKPDDAGTGKADAPATLPAAGSVTIAAVTYRAMGPKSGRVTLSGRGAPGASVELAVDGKDVGTTTADASGRWLHESETWVPPGKHEATAEVVGAASTPAFKFAFERAAPAAGETTVAAPVTTTPGAPVGSGEDSAAAAAAVTTTAPVSAPLAIAAVSYESMGPKQGRITVAGRGTANADVRVTVDGVIVGAAVVGADGAWRLRHSHWVAPGTHAIRAEEVEADGTIIAGAGIDFLRETPAEDVKTAASDAVPVAEGDAGDGGEAAVGATIESSKKKISAKRKARRHAKFATSAAAKRRAHGGRKVARRAKARTKLVTVIRGDGTFERVRVRLRRQPRVLGFITGHGNGRWYRVRRGDTLWAIARRRYGHGKRFPVIVAANSKRIRDPNQIYANTNLFLPAV